MNYPVLAKACIFQPNWEYLPAHIQQIVYTEAELHAFRIKHQSGNLRIIYEEIDSIVEKFISYLLEHGKPLPLNLMADAQHLSINLTEEELLYIQSRMADVELVAKAPGGDGRFDNYAISDVWKDYLKTKTYFDWLTENEEEETVLEVETNDNAPAATLVTAEATQPAPKADGQQPKNKPFLSSVAKWLKRK